MAYNHPYPLVIENGDLRYDLLVYPDASVHEPGQTYKRRGSVWTYLRKMTTNDCLEASRACDGLVETIDRLCDNLDWDEWAEKCIQSDREENDVAHHIEEAQTYGSFSESL